MSVLNYKGYQATVTYEDGQLIIRVLHVRDFLSTQCESANEIDGAFKAVVDEYLAECKALGRSPNKPFRGTFNVRISPDLHRRVAIAAAEEEMSLNSWVAMSLEASVLEPASKYSLDESIALGIRQFLGRIYETGALEQSIWSVRNPSPNEFFGVNLIPMQSEDGFSEEFVKSRIASLGSGVEQ